MKSKSLIFNLWLWKMAWRDSRTHRKRLFLFMTSIVLGIAALVSIGSFGQTLEKAINDQAKTLLGADLMLSSLQPFTPEVEALIDSIGGEQTREWIFVSMAYFPKSGNARLVQVRALDGGFPYYGEITTEPKAATETYKTGANALVDDVLMLQYNANPGDSIKIGATTFNISGRITKTPSNPPIASTFNPRVYLPPEYLEATRLIQPGSLIRYRIYFKFEDNRDVEALARAIEPYRYKYRLRLDTVEERKEDIGEVMGNVYRFLSLVGFVALILGSIGVASAVHVYTKQKLQNVSILRCVGANSKQAFLIYLIQIGVMALFGSFLGAIVGLGIQILLPNIFSEFLPVEVEFALSWQAILQGMSIGLGLSLLFALAPLLSIRRVSPLLALRASYETSTGSKDNLRWLIILLIVSGVGGFAIWQTQDPLLGAIFTTAILIAFAVLAGVAKMITIFFKKFFPKSWPYVWRQGLANLYRPNNQTLVLMLSIGLGTHLITTLYLSHNTLLEKVTYVAGGNRPNLILFDIQPDQKEEIRSLVQSHDLPVVQEAPIVTMRIASINGTTVEEFLSDTTRSISRGLLNWEYRTTYRDSLLDSEEIMSGSWQGQVEEGVDTIPISFEEGSAERLNVSLGDTIVWDVQGVLVTTTIASLRKVDWQRIQANFMVVFPEGALEYAPQIYVLATKIPATEKSAKLQRAVVQAFPNVSIIDLALVLSTLDSFLSKMSFVIRFMAFFSIFTGLIVLAAAVITSRFQRVQESVLLRTLGASRQQINKIMVIEYIFLGGFAALTGLVLSYLASWALAFFVFEAVFIPTVLPFVVMISTVIGLTVLIGMLNSRGILDRP
ncbi:MAG: ABC transporter permease, partial [bacterium]